jgi:hypothetical protein
MKKTWILAAFGAAVVAALAFATAGGCSGDDGGGETGGNGPGGKKLSGDPCTDDTECLGELCLTTETLKSLTSGMASAEIPGGYCTNITCQLNTPDEAVCGAGGFCFNLQQYGQPIGFCGKICMADKDCRTGYICTDGAYAPKGYEPLPHKVCMAPSLLCLIDIPQPECPDVGAGGGGGAGGAGGAPGTGGGGGAGG